MCLPPLPLLRPYLYEAFVCSTMWHEGVPEGFTHMGPDEREPPNTSLERARGV